MINIHCKSLRDTWKSARCVGAFHANIYGNKWHSMTDVFLAWPRPIFYCVSCGLCCDNTCVWVSMTRIRGWLIGQTVTHLFCSNNYVGMIGTNYNKFCDRKYLKMKIFYYDLSLVLRKWHFCQYICMLKFLNWSDGYLSYVRQTDLWILM